MKNTQQTIGIEDELLDISSFPCSLQYLSPVQSLYLSCPPSSYDMNLSIMFFVIPFMLNYCPLSGIILEY